MKAISEVGLALRLLARDQRAGELTLIALALVVAVASVTAVGFFTDRMHRALYRQATHLLGADLVIAGDRPLPPQFAAEAERRGLAHTPVLRFPSMAVRGDRNVLASVKVVAPGYPLRGEVRTAERLYGEDRRATGIPAPGTVWADERLVSRLGLQVGSEIELGRKRFTVAAILTQEPDTTISFLNIGPRLYLNAADLEATGLVQPGSRIRYRLQLAGSAGAVDAYRNWLVPRLEGGERLESVRDAQPQIRAALDRAEKFLGLAALISVALAAGAVALATRRFVQRHFDGCAMMRCAGATQSKIVRLYFVHFFVMGSAASLIGCAVGAVAQIPLAHWLAELVGVQLPAPAASPALQGVAIGLALLLGFALPPLAGLGRVPTLRVLRRELGPPQAGRIAGYGLALLVIAALVLWKANDLRLGGLVLGGFVGAVALAGLLVWVVIRLLARIRHGSVAWRFGIANLQRHAASSIVQVVALALGIMALLTLTVIRGDLMRTWQEGLPPDAPNRFIVGIQPDQRVPLASFFEAHGSAPPSVFPMVRGRLVTINGRAVSSEDYTDARAKRLIDREFNLSWATTVQEDNRIVAGRWWGKTPARSDQFSMEQGIAETLGVKLGDELTFDVAGTSVTAPVTNLREVDWDSFHVNFFVIAAPGLLEEQPASYVTSFYLPPGGIGLLNELVQVFPNFLVIDVARIIAQVQHMMDQVAHAVQFVFLFTVLAGLVVLYAAMASTQDERLYQATLMRTLGASRLQIARANLAEFTAIGALAGLIGAAGANALGFILAHRVLNLDFVFSGSVWILGIACGAVGIAAAGYAGTRRTFQVAPLKILQRLS